MPMKRLENMTVYELKAEEKHMREGFADLFTGTLDDLDHGRVPDNTLRKLRIWYYRWHRAVGMLVNKGVIVRNSIDQWTLGYAFLHYYHYKGIPQSEVFGIDIKKVVDLGVMESQIK